MQDQASQEDAEKISEFSLTKVSPDRNYTDFEKAINREEIKRHRLELKCALEEKRIAIAEAKIAHFRLKSKSQGGETSNLNKNCDSSRAKKLVFPLYPETRKLIEAIKKKS